MADKKTDDQKKHQDVGLKEVLGSLAEVASATTQFTMQQMQNAVTMVIHPSEAMGIVKESLDTIKHAMHPAAPHAESAAGEAAPEAKVRPAEAPLTGRKS